jgi:L-lactate utilization protein LutB
MSRSLMGLDNVEWTANILDESNKENIVPIKSKKELKVELAKLIVKYNSKEVEVDVVIDLINLIYGKPKHL